MLVHTHKLVFALMDGSGLNHRGAKELSIYFTVVVS